MTVPPLLWRVGLAFAALGVAFVGALLVMAGQRGGWLPIALGLPLSGALALAGDRLGAGFGPTLRGRALALANRTRPWHAWMALYVALKIPVPLWPGGFPALGLASTAALFASALWYAAGCLGGGRVGWARAAGLAALAFLAGWGAELLGSHTGFPFGRYSYAGAPGPLLLGVPLIVPLGWFALTLAATRLAGGRPVLAGGLLALWDVGLEPLMTAQGFWTWSDPRPLWAGAPLQNFLGWWAVGGLIAWALTRLGPELFARRPQGRRPEQGGDFALAYPIETFFLPGGLVLVGRPAEAGVTLLAMGLGLGLARAVRRG
ncbi:carotenoid biosynthesis protein [Deinococcus petrolearius]|uniref:Carotenoid biosynthesis protein n=1 Tax=Deinococcus petrolearius TaxID=1751295 RepID=A0ABW1DJE9_9DEIO